MAKIIETKVESRTVSTSYSLWRISLIGVTLGFLFWGFTALFGRFTSSTTIPGDIATILVATIGTVVMVRLFMVRPLFIALAAAASLWGLAQWSYGLTWWEVLAWEVLLYGLTYTLFSWVSRYSRLTPVLIIIISIVIMVRITTIL